MLERSWYGMFSISIVSIASRSYGFRPRDSPHLDLVFITQQAGEPAVSKDSNPEHDHTQVNRYCQDRAPARSRKMGLEMAQFYPDSRPARSLAALKLLRPDHSQRVAVTVSSKSTVRRFRVPNRFTDRPGGQAGGKYEV